MNRIYTFFFLLFCALFLVCFIYCTLISWICVQLFNSQTLPGLALAPRSFSPYLDIGLIKGIVYALILFLMVIGLFQKSLQSRQKFTIKQILKATLWFFIVTTIVHLFYYLVTPGGLNLMRIGWLGTLQILLPPLFWAPFVLGWIILFVILFSRIKS